MKTFHVAILLSFLVGFSLGHPQTFDHDELHGEQGPDGEYEDSALDGLI